MPESLQRASSRTMKRVRIALFALLGLSGLARAQELIAELDLKFVRETRQVVALMCLDDDCVPSAYGYVFEARVKRRIFGAAPEGRFTVLYGHHALPTKNFAGVVARVNKLEKKVEGAAAQSQRLVQGRDHRGRCRAARSDLRRGVQVPHARDPQPVALRLQPTVDSARQTV